MLRLIAAAVLGIGSWAGVVGLGTLSIAPFQEKSTEFYLMGSGLVCASVIIICVAAWIDEKFQASLN